MHQYSLNMAKKCLSPALVLVHDTIFCLFYLLWGASIRKSASITLNKVMLKGAYLCGADMK